MDSNPYAPPAAQLEDIEVASNAYYVVSTRKFWILLIATLGVYKLYWFYRNWRLQKTIHGGREMPVLRAIFSVFFTHSLFRRVESDAAERDHSSEGGLDSMATLYVVAAVAGYILERLAYKEIGSPVTDLLSICTLWPVGIALSRAQLAINSLCNDPDGTSNHEMSGANFVWLVLGAILWILVLIGIYDMLFGLPAF